MTIEWTDDDRCPWCKRVIRNDDPARQEPYCVHCGATTCDSCGHSEPSMAEMVNNGCRVFCPKCKETIRFNPTTGADIVSLVKTHRLPLNKEKELQSELAKLLTGKGYEFSREHRLSAKDIPDFMVGGIMIECKMRGQNKREIYRQLCRYAEHDEVKEIVLVTNVAMGLPEEINGKPAYYANLSASWI